MLQIEQLFDSKSETIYTSAFVLPRIEIEKYYSNITNLSAVVQLSFINDFLNNKQFV